jgi:uncharacterized membrane protein HdeD (DUF308 family)
MRTIAQDVGASLREAQKAWGWYLALGIVLILTGVYAIYAGEAATIASVIVLGVVLTIAGIAQTIGAFMARGAGHVILALLVGILDIVVGLLLLQHPAVGALTVTLLLAALFVFGGIYRFVMALWLQFPQYGWVALSGGLSFILGLLLWFQWPSSAAWFLGFVVGLNFIFAGVMWSAVALRLRSAKDALSPVAGA